MSAPILLTSTINQIEVVRRCCVLAQAAGIKLNMPANLAYAMLKTQPVVLPFRPLSDYRSLFRLALRALSIAPLVSLDNDLRRAFQSGALFDVSPEYNGFFIDISGTERLHQGEENLIERMHSGFIRRGILDAYIATASTIGCAWAHSRSKIKQSTIIPATETRSSLLPLPIAALRLDPATITALQELGVHSIQELLKIPLKEVGLRFGVQPLRRIHQALGTIDEQLEAIKPEPVYKRVQEFEIPLEQLAHAQAIALQLFHALLTDLNLYGLKANSFEITCTAKPINEDKKILKKEISLQSASAETASLLAIIAPVIESFKFPGSIVALEVTAQGVTQQIQEQHQITESPYERELQGYTDQLINTLTARLGSTRVRKVVFKNSFIPEKSFEFISITGGGTGHRDIQSTQSSTPPASSFSYCPPHLPPRPTQLFRKAERISAVALLPDRPPAQIEWRGAIYKIMKGLGPERITPEWWETFSHTHSSSAPSLKNTSPIEAMVAHTSRATRDYFTLQDHTGRWLWVYRSQEIASNNSSAKASASIAYDYSWWVQGIW